MNTLVVKDKNFTYKDKLYSIDDLFDGEFYLKYNIMADKFYNETFTANELYVGLIQKYLVLDDFISKNSVDKIIIENTDSLTEAIFRDIAERNSFRIKGGKGFFKRQIACRFKSFFIQLASALYLLYLMARIPYKKEEKREYDHFSILRGTKRKIKINFDTIDINKEIEDPYYKQSIYRLFPLSVRFCMVINAFFSSFGYLSNFRKLTKEYVGANSQIHIDIFYGKRIVHTLLFKELLDRYFRVRQNKIFYTENNLDRFSIIEEQLAHKYNIKVLCIPHGLEYGFKFPKGFSGDIHYTTSEYAQNYLNELYNTSKFIFDSDVAISMFKVKKEIEPNGMKVIFFTEPREVYVNHEIIEGLLPLMKQNGIKLYLKLHPGDKKSDYAQFKLEILNDLSEAIVGNICISRKSTILLEAIYNNSDSVAILTNKKDEAIFNTFASLQSERIKVTKSIEELFDWLKEIYDKQ